MSRRQREPASERSPVKIFTTAALRLSLFAGAVLLFFWLQEDPERWNVAMLWLFVGLMGLSVWYLTPRVLRSALHWWRERELLTHVGISALAGGVISAPLTVYLLGVGAGALVMIFFALFWFAAFVMLALFSDDAD